MLNYRTLRSVGVLVLNDDKLLCKLIVRVDVELLDYRDRY